MGAWGNRNFENDDALDFVGELCEKNGNSIELFTAINIVAEKDGEEGPDAIESSCALVAIEFLAAANGSPSIDLPENAEDWLSRNDPLRMKEAGGQGVFPEQLRLLSIQAIEQITDNSELKELWEESDEFAEWLSVLEDLRKRIS